MLRVFNIDGKIMDNINETEEEKNYIAPYFIYIEWPVYLGCFKLVLKQSPTLNGKLSIYTSQEKQTGLDLFSFKI